MMKLCPLAVLCIPLLASSTTGSNLLPDPASGTNAWRAWSARPQIAAGARVARESGEAILLLEADQFASYGKWTALAQPITSGKYYRFQVEYKPRNIPNEDVSVAVILSWCKDADCKAAPVQRDYVDKVAGTDGEWRKLERTLAAPEGAVAARVELGLRWAQAGGSLAFRSPELIAAPRPKRRMARIVTTHIRPRPPVTVKSNLETMAAIIDIAGAQKPDLVVLSENFVDRGVGRPLAETSEKVPGPATEMLSRKAREYGTYIVTTLHESDGELIYNTAVLIDRKGRLIGKYRKVHLAMEEGERGITPGSEYPVFDTDFGKLGILTCWDNWFVETARILRLKGAEILALPIAGDGVPGHWDIISRARAIDNGVYLVSSNTVGESSSRIIAPTGKVLAETIDEFGIASAEVDLDAVERVRWLSVGAGMGDPRSLYIKERRPDTYKAIGADVLGRVE